MSRDSYESETTVSREEAAAVLSGVADGLYTGSVELGAGDDAVTVETPAEMDLEIEFETEGDERSLELELEWSVSDEGDAVRSAAEGSESAVEHSGEDGSAVPVGAVGASESLARFEVFRDKESEWRWRLRHHNGNVIATSGEGYTRKHNAWKGLRSVMRNAPGADVNEDASD